MNIEKRVKLVSVRLAMFAAFAVNTIAWAADVTLSFGASGGSKTTSQFSLGSQALTFDRTTIPSWITGLTLHQSIGGMINNTIGLTPAVGSWNTSGSSSTCTLDVTVAENTGAARSWTMNILNQSNGSVAWSMLVSQSAGSGESSSQYTWTYSGGATSGLTITGVSPQPSGFVEIPAVLDGMPVVKLDMKFVIGNPSVETSFVVPIGVVELGREVFNALNCSNVKDIFLPPSLVSQGWRGVALSKGATMHWVMGESAIQSGLSSNFYGAMDIIGLGDVPAGAEAVFGNGYAHPEAITYRCKRAYKAAWDAFFEGKDAAFLGYIDDNYEYSDPVVVTFDANGSDEGFVFVKMRGFELGSLPMPVREGYVFAGWFTAAEGGTRVSASTIVADDVKYYAHWISDRCEYAGYTWYYTGDDKGLVITNVSPTVRGSLCIPTSLNGVRVHRCMGTILDLSLVSKVIVPDGVNSLWGNVFHCDFDSKRGLDVYLAPSVTNLANGYCFSQGHYTIHWTLAEDALSIDTYAFNAFYGNLEVTALGGVPLGMVKDGLYYFNHFGNAKITYICKRAYKAEWDAFFAGTTAEFVGYIDDDYSYSDPVSTITFDSNGGMVAEVCRTLPNGDFLGILPCPSKDGYAFVGWWTAAEGGRQISLGTEISGDAVWYAHWLPACSVTFDANGGSIAETMRIVPLNGTVGALPWPCRPGFQFDGWWTAPSGGVAVAAKTVVTGDVLYYAHWRVSAYEWQFTGDSESGLTITNVSPTFSGHVEVPATLYDAPIRQLLGEPIYLKMITASSIVIPNGVTGIGTKTYSGSQYSQADFFVPPSCNTLLDAYAFRGITGTVHWLVDKTPLSIHFTAFSGFCGTLDVVALGGVPSGMVKEGLYSFGPAGSKIVYRCKRAYKEEWVAFYEGTEATFLGYIDDDYEYLDPILTVNNGVLEDVQLMGGRDVVIPDGVTGIGANAFAGNTLLRSVTIPAGVATIAPGAFNGCTGLEAISIAYSLDDELGAAFPNGLGNVEIVFTDDDMTTGGDAEWRVDTTMVHGGMISRRSGVIGNDQTSWIEIRTQNPGRLSFWWKASSESDGDCVFDYAYLSIDGEPQGTLLSGNDEYEPDGVAIGGKTDWQQVVLNVKGEGPHTIRWTYCKDEVDEGDTGEDCVWRTMFAFTPLVSVAYDLGGGTGAVPVGFTESFGTVVTLPTQSGFDRTDYIFNGWSDGATLYLAGASYTVPYSDVTLTAQWTKKTFLTFALGGGTGTTPAVVKELRGTVVTLPGQSGFDRTDYAFNGWNDGTTFYAAGAQFTMPPDDVTLTAQWTKKTFLTFALGGGTGTTPTTVKELRGSVVTLPGQDGFSRTDYVFDGWSDGNATYAAGTDYTMPSADVTLTAQWIVKRFLTFTLDGGDGATPAMIKDVPGTTVTLPSADGIAKPKHTFVGWSDGTSIYGAGADYTVTDSGVEFMAVWRRNETYVSIASTDVTDGGMISVHGATITMSAWSDPSGGTPTIYYNLDGSMPTTNSARYAAPFFVDGLGEVTVKAIAVMDNYFDSEVATFTFTRLPYSSAECIGLAGATVTTGGDAAWFRVTGDDAHDGIAALRSGAIGDGENTYVEMTVDRPGEISFWWKVSSQNKVRTNKHDYLSFSIDGTDVSTLGGGVIDWTNETFSVTGTGSHTLRWTYQKDSDGKSANEDCAWLDDVVWTPTPPFVVTLDANGGSVEPMTCSVPVGSNVGSLPIPSYEGHLFIGWFTGVEDGEQVTSETVVDSDTVFYAHWMDMPKEHAWTGGAGDGFFSTPGNWQYGVVPPDGADVRIGCAETATLTCDIAFRPKSITFPLSSANVTIVGEGSLSGLVAMTNESACHHVINVPVAFAENIEADVTMNKTSYMNFAGGMTAWSIKNAGEDAYYCGNISLEKEGDNWSADEKDFSIIVSGSSLMLPTSESIGAPNFKIETGSRVVINGDFTVSESEGNSTLRRFMTSRNAGVFEVKGHVIAAGNSFEACYYNASGLFVAKGLVCSVHKDYFHLNGRSGERANVKWVVGSDGLSSTSGSYWTLHNGGDTSLYPMADYSINSKIESHYPSLTIYTTDYFTNSIGRTVTVNKKLLATYAAVVRGKGKVVFNADFEFSKKLNAKYLVTLQIVAGVKSKIGQLVMDAGTTLALPTAGTATISLGGSFTTAGDGKVKIALGNTNEVVSVGTYTLLTATSLPDLSRLELVNAADGFVKFFASSDGKTLFLRVTTNKEFGPGDTTCIGGSVYLNSAQATWLNALGDYDTVNSAVETMDAEAFEEAYLLNLDVTDGGRGYSFEVTDCDATGENVVVTVRLVRTGAVQKSGGDAPINGVLRLYGSATPAASGFAPIAAATVSDATFANGGTATLTFGKDESIRFFKAYIVSP